MLRTLFVSFVISLYILVLGPPLLLASAITGNTDALYKVGILGARLALWLAGVKVHVEGREKVPTGRPVVFMPNHQSNCDPPAVAVHLPPVLVMAKKEFFRVPILGVGMRMRGFIPVDRRSREQAFTAVDRAISLIRKGHSFLVYPEGTRSPDGRLRAFKGGVFFMAIEAGAPIIPISVSGARNIMRKGEFALHPGEISLTIHNPIPTDHCAVEDRERIMAEVRQAILSGLVPEEWPAQTSVD